MLVWPRFDETYYDEIILGIRIGNSCWLLAKQRPIMIYQVVWHWAYSILSSKGGRERESLEPKTTLLLFREVAVAWLSSSWYIFGRLLSFTNYHQERTQKKHPDKNIFGHCGLSDPADLFRNFFLGARVLRLFATQIPTLFFVITKAVVLSFYDINLCLGFLQKRSVFRDFVQTILAQPFRACQQKAAHSDKNYKQP